MSEMAPDPLEGQVADMELIRDAVLAEVRHSIRASTGGQAKGCTLCAKKTFRERCAVGHFDCAEEMAREKGAQGVRDSLVCGGLNAALLRVVADPRLGEWKRHLDWWAQR